MAKKILPLNVPDEVELAFYEALQSADIEQLMGCWADAEEVVCVSPGGPRLIGKVGIRQVFDAVFSNGPVRIKAHKVHRIQTEAIAVHSVLEGVELSGNDAPRTVWVWATNVYVRQPEGWRLVSHHASTASDEHINESDGGSKMLH
jgi:ketosteroid isomerase-like protein